MALRSSTRTVTYGLEAGARLRAVNLHRGVDGSRFAVAIDGDAVGEVELALPGRHNVLNCLAAVAIGLELGLTVERMAPALRAFAGVERRFQLVGERDGVTVVDDYAHHPTELRALLEAARGRFPGRRLVVAFQPHLYSRTKTLAEELGSALALADVALVLPVFPAREAPIPGVTARLVADAARRHGAARVEELPPPGEISGILDRELKAGDVLLTVGAGDVNRVGVRWLGGVG